MTGAQSVAAAHMPTPASAPAYQACAPSSPQRVHCPSCHKEQTTSVHIQRRKNLASRARSLVSTVSAAQDSKVEHSCSLCNALLASVKGDDVPAVVAALPSYADAMVFYDKRKNVIQIGSASLLSTPESGRTGP